MLHTRVVPSFKYSNKLPSLDVTFFVKKNKGGWSQAGHVLFSLVPPYLNTFNSLLFTWLLTLLDVEVVTIDQEVRITLIL